MKITFQTVSAKELSIQPKLTYVDYIQKPACEDWWGFGENGEWGGSKRQQSILPRPWA